VAVGAEILPVLGAALLLRKGELMRQFEMRLLLAHLA
jgi:hypothetical protein